MKENFYRNRIGYYKVDHSTFGGLINEDDFNFPRIRLGEMAERIAKAERFDRSCAKNDDDRKRHETYIRRGLQLGK